MQTKGLNMLKSTRKLLLLSLFFSPMAFGAVVTSKVTYTGTYGDGRFFVGFEDTLEEAGCPSNRIHVDPENPQIARWLSVALTAYASKSSVTVKSKGCYEGFPTLDQTSDTFFHIK